MVIVGLMSMKIRMTSKVEEVACLLHVASDFLRRNLILQLMQLHTCLRFEVKMPIVIGQILPCCSRSLTCTNTCSCIRSRALTESKAVSAQASGSKVYQQTIVCLPTAEKPSFIQ